MKKGTSLTAFVIDVKDDTYRKPNSNIITHTVTFKMGEAGSNYIAEEPNELVKSTFVAGMYCTFEVTAEGNNGKKDWIKFIAFGERPPVDRVKLDVAKVAFMAAAQLGVKYEWNEVTVLEKALEFGEKILLIADQL